LEEHPSDEERQKGTGKECEGALHVAKATPPARFGSGFKIYETVSPICYRRCQSGEKNAGEMLYLKTGYVFFLPKTQICRVREQSAPSRRKTKTSGFH
jgi:hypothetical protein